MPYFPQDKSDKDVRIAMLAGKEFDGAAAFQRDSPIRKIVDTVLKEPFEMASGSFIFFA